LFLFDTPPIVPFVKFFQNATEIVFASRIETL